MSSDVGECAEVGLYRHDKYSDITEQFWKNCSELGQGELVKEDGFTLLEGVHALEIWDDRMDTGVYFRSLQDEISALSNEVVFDESSVAAIFDFLLAREMAWHRGSMLSQTVFSCVYVEEVLQQVTAIENKLGNTSRKESSTREMNALLDFDISSWAHVLRAYILASIKSIDLAILTMDPNTNQALYPEEDIVVNTFGLSPLHSVQPDRVLRILERAIKWVTTQVSVDSKHGIVDRLKLRHEWMLILQQQIPSKTVHLKEALRHLKAISLSFDSAQNSGTSETITTKVDVVEKPEGIERIFSNGFQSRVNNFSPLRPLTTLSVVNSYNQLQQIVESVLEIKQVAEIKTSSDLLSFFLNFSEKRALPYIRALLKTYVSDTMVVNIPVRDWLIKDITETVGFPSIMQLLQSSHSHSHSHSHSKQLDPQLDLFLKEAQLCYVDLLCVMCHNRSRQRQNLAHCIVSWDSLQVQAEQTDEYLTQRLGVQNSCIASWVFARKMQILTWVVLLGFELDLYKPFEFAYMYFYLHYLLTNMISHLSEIRLSLEALNLRNSSIYVRSLELEARALDQLTQGSMYLCAYYNPQPPPQSRTTSQLLYGLRMKPFSSIGVPELPTYDMVQQQLFGEKALTGNNALQMSRTLVDSARKLLSTLNEVSTKSPHIELLKRSCVGIGIQVAVAKTRKPDSTFTVVKEGYHAYFPVLSLERK